MTRLAAVLIAMVLSLTAQGYADQPVAFTRKPTVTSDSDGLKIGFAVNKPTDVAVAIVDGDGRIVRHLAAGVLGPKAPAPLKPDALEQTLVWDGKDDAGNLVARDTVSVRVQAGLTPTLDGYLLFDPDATPDVHSVAVAGGGQIYAFYKDPTANGNQGGLKIRLMDRQGRHVRQVMPFAASLPFEKIKASGAFQDEAGRTVPQTWNWHTLSFYPDHHIARYRSMSSLSMPVAEASGRLHWLIDGGRLCSLDPDGSIPYPTFMTEPLFGEIPHLGGGRPVLAISSDGKSLFASGVWAGGYLKSKPIPAVWKIDLATRKAELFLGKLEQTREEGDLLLSPRGLATHKGRLYVADPDANRIAIFDEQGKKLVGEMKVVAPHIVQVHPATEAVYVCAYMPEEKPRGDGQPRNVDANLLKFANSSAEKPDLQLALPRTGLSPNYGTHRIVLDSSGPEPIIWVPGIPYSRGATRLSCYRDTGSAFEPVEVRQPQELWGNGPRDLICDRARDELYVKVQGERWHQFDCKSHQVVRTIQFPRNVGGPYMGSSGSQLGIDTAGNYITHCWGDKSGMMRWSRDLKPLNWDGQDTHRTDWGGMMTFQLNYMALLGDLIYVIKPEKGPHHLEVYDMSLNVKRRVVWNARRGSCPRVDAKGNVYITMPLRPADRDFPEFFDGKLGEVPDYTRGIGGGHYWYVYMYGSIVKFPPEGGAFHWIETDREKNDLTGLPPAVAAKPKEKFQYFQNGYYPHKIAEVQGAEWVRFGYSPYSETYPAGTPVCMCEGAGFDVDGFGRVFYPNLCQFRIEMLDTNNNRIGNFGQYGNVDDKAEPGKPVVPLAWPTYVATSGRHLYVNDTINMRVVKVKMDYAAEETISAK